MYFCYLNPEAETMKKNYLKIIVAIAAMIPCLSACNKYHEGKLVEAECIYNGYEEAPDFNKSLTINTKDYEGLEVKGHGDYFYIGSFKIYDSLYLADVNGDGRRDFCTEFRYLNKSQYYHGYAFFDIKKNAYLEYFLPDNGKSYYLGEKDGYLIIKEFYGQHNPTTYKEGINYRRTATVLTDKERPQLVWKDEEFNPHSCSAVFKNVNNGSWAVGDQETKEQRFVCATERANDLFIMYSFNGVLTFDSDYANDCLTYEKSDAYEITFNKDKTNNTETNLNSGTCELWYTVTFKKEGKYDVKINIKNLEMVISVIVDNALYYKN